MTAAELKENPFRKPQERLEFFKKLVKMHPTKEVEKFVVKQSPANKPAETKST